MKATDPKGPGKSFSHVFRGGCLCSDPDRLDTLTRNTSQGMRGWGIGFRIVCNGSRK